MCRALSAILARKGMSKARNDQTDPQKSQNGAVCDVFVSETTKFMAFQVQGLQGRISGGQCLPTPEIAWEGF